MADGAQAPSEKRRRFVSEPMGEKLVTDLEGIGPIYGERLREAGFRKAFHVFGQFLVLNKDEGRFVEWLLAATASTNNKCAKDCYNCLRVWNDAFGQF